MDVPCTACLNKPNGIDGHADMRVRGIGNARMSFECARCGALWARVKSKAGYAWSGPAPAGAEQEAPGVLVPPRTNPAPQTRESTFIPAMPAMVR